MAVSGEIDPTTGPTETSHSISAGGTFTIPRGIYMALSVPAFVRPQYNLDSTWLNMGIDDETVVVSIISDGTNARLKNNAGTSKSGILLKF
jgi:hypothetical protein